MAGKKPQLHLSKPADRSLQAFKNWMQTMGDKLMPGSPPDDATEEEWIADHKEFWAGVDEGLAEKDNKKPQLHLTRPADRSLEAFKKWMTDLAQRLVPGAPNDMTEEMWVAKHGEFWERLDKGLAKKNDKTAT